MDTSTRRRASFTGIWARMFKLYGRSWKGVFAYSAMVGSAFAVIDYLDLSGGGVNSATSIAMVMAAAGITLIVGDRYVVASAAEQAELRKAGFRFLP